jgi:vitamin B12 transporter
MFRRFVPLVVSLFFSAAPASAQTNIAGAVVDEAGSAVQGVQISLTDAKGGVVRSTVSGSKGTFELSGVIDGSYNVVAERRLFRTETLPLTVAGGSAAPLTITLRPGGFAEQVVVTARRTDTRLAEVPQTMQIVEEEDIERTVSSDITDVLKKNSGVDVIQYTGALSGIGIRGFRPQFSGINKRSLLLIDGRPSGVTNLAGLLTDGVERIEVLKGAASALYGSSAMGGVVNIIPRQSQGDIAGNLRIGLGSYDVRELAGRAGGNATPRVDFDVTGSMFEQNDDIKMGNGVVRPATAYKTYNGAGRIGATLGNGWRFHGRGDVYRGRDIETPPDLAAGNIGQGRKNLERGGGDARLLGQLGKHVVSFAGYAALENSHSFNVTTSNPADLPFLPFLSFENEFDWKGVQVRDVWAWSTRNNVVMGADFDRVDALSRSYTPAGDQSAPFSANANKRTVAFYAENTLRLGEGKTVVTLGGRLDRITTETVATPLKTNFTPSQSTFNVFNPSIGVKHQLAPGLRVHGTAGRAFIPAEASMLTGFTTTVVGGRTQISQGNPDLRPERSTSVDAGLDWSNTRSRIDATYFRTKVKDRFISNVVVSNPAAPAPILLSTTNGLDAKLSGLEVEAEHRFSAKVSVFGSATHYFERSELLASGARQEILNTAKTSFRFGLDLDVGRVSGRFSGRHLSGRTDNDFNAPGFPIVDYDDLTVFDATLIARLARHHGAQVSLNNLFDSFYYEKIGHPLQGRSFRASYKFEF